MAYLTYHAYMALQAELQATLARSRRIKAKKGRNKNVAQRVADSLSESASAGGGEAAVSGDTIVLTNMQEFVKSVVVERSEDGGSKAAASSTAEPESADTSKAGMSGWIEATAENELEDNERKKVFFIHMNHTNPLLNPKSEATKKVKALGFSVARIGDTFSL